MRGRDRERKEAAINSRSQGTLMMKQLSRREPEGAAFLIKAQKRGCGEEKE